MQAKDLLTFAQELMAARRPREIHFREAARLAYYAVFHLLRVHYRIGQDVERIHLHLKQTLHAEPMAVALRMVREAKPRLSTLQANRVAADYDLEQAFTESRARESIAHAERIFNAAST